LILPTEKKPTYFPNAANVLVIMDANGHTVAVGVYNGSDSPIVIMMASPAQALDWRTKLIQSYA